MLWMLSIIAVLTAVLTVVVYFGGWFGRSSILSRKDAKGLLANVLEAVPPFDPPPLMDRTGIVLSSSEQPPASDGPSRPSSSPQSGRTRGSALFDFGVPAGLAGVVTLHDWATPAPAAVAAVEQLTHEEISGALDLHRAFAENHYRLWTDGSLNKWRGHTFEQQIDEQVESWAGEGATSMPDASNYAGADNTIFGYEYQAKSYGDFNDIENIHGDPLIVPEGIDNLPPDALYLDFSEPFDPSILEGHDVIVAEGITLAGSDHAWESAAGLAAGGVDLADVGDAAMDMSIPGLGAAIRVAASGYRRRAALADPQLRAETAGRVGRDAVYGVAGAGAGGAIGLLVGASVDVLSLGLTMGMGTVIGSMIGAGAGGMAAGAAASAGDQARIDEAARKTQEAMEGYGQAVEIVQAESREQWADAMLDAESRARDVGARLDRSIDNLDHRVRDDLGRALQMAEDEAIALLRHSYQVVQAVSISERGPRAKRLQKGWLIGLEEVRQAPLCNEEVLLLMVAVPGGTSIVERWLRDRAARRTVILGAATVVLEEHMHIALNERLECQKALALKRDELGQAARKELDPFAGEVSRCTNKLKRELAIAGRG